MKFDTKRDYKIKEYCSKIMNKFYSTCLDTAWVKEKLIDITIIVRKLNNFTATEVALVVHNVFSTMRRIISFLLFIVISKYVLIYVTSMDLIRISNNNAIRLQR